MSSNLVLESKFNKDVSNMLLQQHPDITTLWKLFLHEFCKAFNMDLGSVWIVNKDESALYNVTTWQENKEFANTEFESVTEKITFDLGIGLPGRVWEIKKFDFIHDVNLDNNFPRKLFAKNIGLRGGLAFPIIVDEKVLAVIEFFSKSVFYANDFSANFFNNISDTIGLYIKNNGLELPSTTKSV